MPIIVNLIGQRFGHLEVLSKVRKPKGLNKYSVNWECRCDCGNISYPRTNDLTDGKTTHCGCIRGTHNRSHTKEYNSWRHIKARCTKVYNSAYPQYGGRGIKMCDRWLNSFEAFLEDMGFAPENSKKYSVERIENSGNYEPGNCKWATYTEQANNRRTSKFLEYQGRVMTFAQWAKELNFSKPATIARRINFGWSVDDAFNHPVRQISK